MNDIDFGDGDVSSNQSSSSRRPKKSSRLGVVTKILLGLLFSFALSALAVGLLNGFLPYTKIAGIKLYGVMRSNIMIGTALATFLLSVIFTYLTFMRGDELQALERRKRNKAKQQARIKRKEAVDSARERKEEKKAKEKQSTEEQEALKKEAEEKLKKEAEKEKVPEDAAPQEDAENTEKEESAQDDDFSSLSPVAEAQKAVLMGFFGEAVRAIPAERRKLDNYNRFGVNLFLAGAAESLGSARNLDADSVASILASSLGVMGLKQEHAEAFAKRYEDYLLQDARYMSMFQSGLQTMGKFVAGDKDAAKALDGFLHEWNKPKAPEDPEKEVVVMFTDIVGSTAMTHEKGNLAAQEVVRAHNRVVRDALAKTGGHEIKHTGDGIMASFEKVTDSLLSTQQMQMMIELHNQQGPEIPLKVKIGINAGRVVVEEKDLYGVTVQMAARIVDKAKADQIFVSDTVYGLVKGGNWRFVKRGPYYLKGIDGPVYLQELVWNDKVDVATVNAQAEAERPQLEQVYAAASGKPMPGQSGAPTPQPEQPAQPKQAEQAEQAAQQAQPTQTPS